MIVEIICPLTLDCYLALPPAFHPKYQVLLAEDTRRLPGECDTNGCRLRPRDLQLQQGSCSIGERLVITASDGQSNLVGPWP